MSLKEILETNKNYYSHLGKSTFEKLSYLMEKNIKLESEEKKPNNINNIISKEGIKEAIEAMDSKYEFDDENIFSKDYDNKHNLDIQEQKLKYFSNVKNPCTYIEKKVKEGKIKIKKIKKNEYEEENNKKPLEDINKINAKKELQKIMDSGFNFNYYHHLFHHTSDANFYSENVKNEFILGPEINATRYSPNLEYVYKKIIYSPSFKLMSGRQDKEKLSEVLKKQLEQKMKKKKEKEKKEKLTENDNIDIKDIKAKTQYKIPKIYFKKSKRNKRNENNDNNTKENTNTKDNKTGSNNNETIFTSNAIKYINNNETNTVNSNSISNNNNMILENELLTVKLTNYYQYKKHKNYRKINLINKNNIFPLKPTHSSSVSNIFKNSKIKNLSFRLNKTTKNSNNNNITNKENTNRNKLKKENSFRIKGPNFQKMIGRQYLSKLKYIEEPMHPQINPNWNSIHPKCIMKINYSHSPIQIKKVNRFLGFDGEATFDMNKLFNKYNNHYPAKSIYFNKMTGRENEKESKLPFYMFNLANRNSCDNFNVKSFKMNNFFEGKFKDPLSTFNQHKSFNYKLKKNMKNNSEKNLNLSTEEKNNKSDVTNLFMKVIENNNNKNKRKILIPKKDFMSKILNRLPEFYRINLDSIKNKNIIDGITFKSYKCNNKENDILSKKEKEIFLLD